MVREQIDVIGLVPDQLSLLLEDRKVPGGNLGIWATAILGKYQFQDYHWLVVWIMNFIFLYIGNVIIPTDFHIFQRGLNHQPDHIEICIYIYMYTDRCIPRYITYSHHIISITSIMDHIYIYILYTFIHTYVYIYNLIYPLKCSNPCVGLAFINFPKQEYSNCGVLFGSDDLSVRGKMEGR